MGDPCSIIRRGKYTIIEVVIIMDLYLSYISIYGCKDICMNIIRQDNSFSLINIYAIGPR
jgi:hypothetical protein